MSNPSDASSSSIVTTTNGSSNVATGADMKALVCSYLQQHPSFFAEYAAQHANSAMVQQWLQKHMQEPLQDTLPEQPGTTETEPLLTRSNSCSVPVSSFGSTMGTNGGGTSSSTPQPLRKISAHEFEQSALRLRPIFTTDSDGRPSFLPPEEPPLQRQWRSVRRDRAPSTCTQHATTSRPSGSMSSSSVCSAPCSFTSLVPPNESSAISNSPPLTPTREFIPLVADQPLTDEIRLKELNLMLDLVKDICDELELKSLCHKILQNVSILTNADRCSLFLVKQDLNEKYFISTLFDVRSDSSIDDQNMCIRIPWNTGVVGYVAKNRVCVNITDCYGDERFHSYVDSVTGYVTRNMISAPILDHDGTVLGVAQAINKQPSPGCTSACAFTKRDEEIFQHFLQFCGIGLKNAHLYEQKRLENLRNQVLLDLCTMIFEQQTHIEEVVHKVMLHTQSLLRVQRVQVMLLRDYAGDQQTGNDFSHLHLLTASQPSTSLDQDTLTRSNSQSEQSEESNCAEPGDSDQGTQFSRLFDMQARGPAIRCERCRTIELHRCLPPRSEPLLEPIMDAQGAQGLQFRERTSSAQVPGVDICVYVAQTGSALNIPECRKDTRFRLNWDQVNDEMNAASMTADGITCTRCQELNRFEARALLCMPIRNAQHKIIGVAQLINKFNGKPFTPHDESLFEAFAIFIGMGIQNTLSYELAMKANAKHQVTLQCLSYHCSASQGSARRLSRKLVPKITLRPAKDWFHCPLPDYSEHRAQLCKSSSSETPTDEQDALLQRIKQTVTKQELDPNIYFEWVSDDEPPVCMLPLTLVDEYFFRSESSLLVSLGFFRDLQLIQQFNIPYITLCRWLLSVQKNYRNVCYHNWRHAFEVAEMMFTILSSSGLLQHLDQIELLALLIGCFCHDLDHRGTNNSFEVKNSSPLAHLYSTSTMEHHHFDQCLMILNSPGNQILSGMSTAEYSRAVELIEDAILATDLAVYLQRRGEFFGSVRDLKAAISGSGRRTLLAMLMTICDLNAVAKPWPLQKHIAEQVAEEFFRQGDFERRLFNQPPADMFNRAKSDELPRMQVEFIGTICQPLFEHFRSLFGNSFMYRDLLFVNKLNWIREASKRTPHLVEWANEQMIAFHEELDTLNVDFDHIRNEAYRQMPEEDEQCEEEHCKVLQSQSAK